MTQRSDALKEMNRIMDTYCEGCAKKREGGRGYKEQICLSQCDIGKLLKKQGDVLKQWKR